MWCVLDNYLRDMEFKKIPAPAQAPQPYIDPDTQMRQSVRLMAKRMLYGTRGLLFIAGSLLLVTGIVELFMLPEISKLNARYWELFPERLGSLRFFPEEWFIFADVLIAVLILAGGWLVTRMPLFFTLVPAVLLAGRIIWATAQSLMSGFIPNILLSLFLAGLTGLLVRGIYEARAFRREVALASEYYRSTAILRQKEARGKR